MSDPVRPTNHWPLCGRRVLLRPLALTDAHIVQHLAGDWAVARMTANIPHPYLDGMAEAWIASSQEEMQNGKGYALAVERIVDHTFLGCISLRPGSEPDRPELGYWLGRQYWKQGYMSEAVELIKAFAFDHLDLDCIWAGCLPENQPSILLLERSGFARVGTYEKFRPQRGSSQLLLRYALRSARTSTEASR
jgi:ribosomal-protein-alanine N-acetyltransferase